jgi:hypothetical protein
MDDKDPHDSELIDLVIRLCTRISMMMEDVSPMALDALNEGLEARVVKVAKAARVIATMADTAEGPPRRPRGLTNRNR